MIEISPNWHKAHPSRDHNHILRPGYLSAKGLRDTSQRSVTDKKVRRVLYKAVETFGGSGVGDHAQLVHLFKWMDTGKNRNGTHYCR